LIYDEVFDVLNAHAVRAGKSSACGADVSCAIFVATVTDDASDDESLRPASPFSDADSCSTRVDLSSTRDDP
jgi:hypothetical protein